MSNKIILTTGIYDAIKDHLRRKSKSQRRSKIGFRTPKRATSTEKSFAGRCSDREPKSDHQRP